MFRIKGHLLLLLFGVSCTGCMTPASFDLDTNRNGTGKSLHAPIQNIQSRTILVDPQRSSNMLQPLSAADLRPVLKVRPEAVAFLSQPAMMLSKNSDGSIGIRRHAPLAFDSNRPEALQAMLQKDGNTLLAQAMVPYLFPACPLLE